MLFSNEVVAEQINTDFEPVWVSVRAVPTVTIDFGNGEVVKRTLHGNVATYVCNADGTMLDVLPGIYEPRTYQRRLNDFVQLHEYVNQESRRGKKYVLRYLREYHRLRIKAIQEDAELSFNAIEQESIVGIERAVLITLEPARRIQARSGRARRDQSQFTSTRMPATDKLSEWESLARDTETNETQRRLMIHQHLWQHFVDQEETLTPEQITKWLYREVLHADLDDPHLGLGKILFDNYPFAEEDAN